MKKECLGLILSLAMFGLLTGEVGAGQVYLSITPSVNFIRIKAESVDVAGVNILSSESKWNTAAGIGISAGLITQSNWRLGLGYEYVGRPKVTVYNNILHGDTHEKFDLHNFHLQARYNFQPSNARLGFFVYGKAGATITHARFSSPGLRLDGDSSNKTHFSYGLGAGASYYFTPRLSGELSGEIFQAVGRKYFENSNAKIGMLGLKIGAGLTLKF